MILLLAALMVSADPAVPQQAGSSAASPAPKAGKEEKICKVDTSDSTSRLRKRICLSQSEWEQKESGKDVSDLKSDSAH